MTVGQRIAQKRKELGLSQETLGEQLGLSRQAVYKWESDAALPEIDKLIALSRLFAVPVGWILGVEAEAQDSAPAGEGELSEAQLAMVQEIVDRYLAARQPQKHRRRPWLLGTAVAIVAAVLFANLFSRLDTVSREYNDLNIAIQNINTGVSMQIGSVTDRVEEIMKSQNDLVADYQIDLDGVDLPANRAVFSVWARPKTCTDNMTAIFTASDGVKELVTTLEPVRVLTTGYFMACLSCPLTDHITVSVTFLDGDQRQTQKLETFDYLLAGTFPRAYVVDMLRLPAEGETVFPSENSFVRLYLEYGTNTPTPYENLPRARISQIRVGLFKDKKMVAVLEPREIESSAPGGGTDTETYYFIPPDVPADRAGTYCVAAIVTDEYQRQRIYTGSMLQYDGETGWCVSQSVYEYGPGETEDIADWEY